MCLLRVLILMKELLHRRSGKLETEVTEVGQFPSLLVSSSHPLHLIIRPPLVIFYHYIPEDCLLSA